MKAFLLARHTVLITESITHYFLVYAETYEQAIEKYYAQPGVKAPDELTKIINVTIF